ncbi:phosphoadenylyl-sulfate reductase [Telmatobacter sp. DSM 110680]|uniref:Adenosine 5'-phosphosulfate reductase n=1 Tax=Telmatobacter sp. DSM 110680 TaxID=3036704 RepID=A0AAU7DKC2_9BACT
MTTASASDALALTASSFLRENLEHAQRACITSSFQAEDVAVLHMVLQHQPQIPVIFLETGYHFPETLAYRDRIAAEWNLNLVNVEAEQSVAEQESQFGILNQTAPDRCCGLRKVEPLFRALGAYTTWVTGLRRQQSKSRANLQPHEFFTLPTGKILAKLSPLTEWTTRDVWQYAEQHSIPLLPLYEQGYTSIGCAPCTSLPFDENDPRSGRWSGRKLECGIHLQAH